MIWEVWWAWMGFAIVLAILELFAPGWVFLGFALGAALVSVLMAFGIVLSLPWLLVIGGVFSLICWVGLRQVVGVRAGQVKTFDHDINED